MSTVSALTKTGTLTEDELNLAEVLPINPKTNEFKSPITNVEALDFGLSNNPDDFLVCMASCHSLTILDNNIIGDPLDIKMFESTKWILGLSLYKLLISRILTNDYYFGEQRSQR